MKRKAFISYAMQDSEQYVLTLLSDLLRSENFQIESSFDSYSNIISQSAFKKISESSLFIGLITEYGNRNDNVFNEWKLAIEKRIPSILLIEDAVPINNQLANHPNVLIFNRHYPQSGLDKVKRQIENAKRLVDKKNNENALGWILGGAAALAIISLLASDD